MIGVHSPDAAVWVAAFAAVGTIITTGLTLMIRRNQSTDNGHSIGRGVARIEDQLREHENRLDRMEVHTVEQFGEIQERLTSAMFDQERHMATYRHNRRLVDE